MPRRSSKDYRIVTIAEGQAQTPFTHDEELEASNPVAAILDRLFGFGKHRGPAIHDLRKRVATMQQAQVSLLMECVSATAGHEVHTALVCRL